MTGDGAETIAQAAALADPVDVAVAVHHDRSARQRLQLAHEPAAVDQRGADALRQRLAALGIFDEMVMQRHDPTRLGKLPGRPRSKARACATETRPSALVKEKCVSALELSSMMPSPSSRCRRQHHRKGVVPQFASQRDDRRSRPVSAKPRSPPMRRQRVGRASRRAARAPGRRRAPASLHGGHRRQRAHLAQPLVGAGRQIEPRRVGAIDDVDVVVARQHQHPPRRAPDGGASASRNSAHSRRAARIGHVAGDEDDVERPLRVDVVQPRQHPAQPLVAARTGPPALDAKAVALADDVEVRQVRDAPVARAGCRLGKDRGRAAGASSRRRSPRPARPTAR